MFQVEASTLEGCFAADPGREADLRAVDRRAGTASHGPAGAVGGDGTIQPVIRTSELGAL